VSYTKRIALHDRISIDGTDVSGSFSQFDLDSTDSDVDVSGFSVSGVDETLSGTRAEGFAGTAFYSEDLASLLWPLHNDRSVFEVLWQPNGLIDDTAAVYYANCQLRTFSPNNTRGSASTMPVSFKVADANGVTKAAGT
jgi:hypothetical protein